MKKLIEFSDLGFADSTMRRSLWVRALLNFARIKDFNTIYSSVVVKGGVDGLFADKLLDELSIEVKEEIEANLEASLSRSEGLIVVSNFPHGGIDALVMLSLCRKYNKNTKIVVPRIVAEVPALESDIIVFDSEDTFPRDAYVVMKKHLDEGGNLIVFPKVGILPKSKGADNSQWNKHLLNLIVKLKAPVQPLFIKGGNSLRFQLLRLMSSCLTSVDFLNQILNKSGATIKVLECPRVSADLISSLGDVTEVGLLFDQAFALALEREKELVGRRDSAQEQLVEQGSAESIAQYRKYIKKNQPYLSSVDYSLYLVPEQFGASLVAVTRENQEIVGYCRVNFGDKILAEDSAKEFAFYSYFDYSRKFSTLLTSSLEVAEMVVLSSKDSDTLVRTILCDGIMQLWDSSDIYTHLIASTTIIDSSSRLARRLMVHQVRRYIYNSEYKRYITPRHVLRAKPFAFMGARYNAITERRDVLSLFIRYSDSNGALLSTELKRYLQRGGQFISLCKEELRGDVVINGLILIHKA